MLSFYYDGVAEIDAANIRDSVAPNVMSGTKVDIEGGNGYWRFENEDGWSVGTEGDVRGFNAENPWTLYSPHHVASLYHAHLENYLVRLKHFFPNRQRVVTALAPTDADTLKKLMPGMPVRVNSTGKDYWITELKISTPPLTMQLNLVYPGDASNLPATAATWTMDNPRPQDDPWDGDLPAEARVRRSMPPTATTADLFNFLPNGDLP